MSALTARFSGWDGAAAARRVSVAAQLAAALLSSAPAELGESVAHAACVLDIGRSVDFFDRHQHAADIVLATELDGFSHREVALLSAILRTARDEDADLRPLAPILKSDDRAGVERRAWCWRWPTTSRSAARGARPSPFAVPSRGTRP